MQVGDKVKITRDSYRLNPHIKGNVGAIAVIEEIDEANNYAEIKIIQGAPLTLRDIAIGLKEPISGGMGSWELDCLEPLRGNKSC